MDHLRLQPGMSLPMGEWMDRLGLAHCCGSRLVESIYNCCYLPSCKGFLVLINAMLWMRKFITNKYSLDWNKSNAIDRKSMFVYSCPYQGCPSSLWRFPRRATQFFPMCLAFLFTQTDCVAVASMSLDSVNERKQSIVINKDLDGGVLQARE